jgi:hypothetical protein
MVCCANMELERTLNAWDQLRLVSIARVQDFRRRRHSLVCELSGSDASMFSAPTLGMGTNIRKGKPASTTVSSPNVLTLAFPKNLKLIRLANCFGPR